MTLYHLKDTRSSNINGAGNFYYYQTFCLDKTMVHFDVLEGVVVLTSSPFLFRKYKR